MVFLFDSKTGDELTNSATTDNGFTIDLARSRYLEVNVKRETLSDNGNELIEDTRSNVPAKDGEEYTEPGVYTITVSNPSTSQSTEKIICVGDNDVLKAYAKTGYSIKEIQSLKKQGAYISDTGDISWNVSDNSTDTSENNSDEEKTASNPTAPIVPIAVVVVVAVGLGATIKRRQATATALGNERASSLASSISSNAANTDEKGDE